MYKIQNVSYFSHLTEAKMSLLYALQDEKEAESGLIEALKASIEAHADKKTLLAIITQHANPTIKNKLQSLIDKIARSPFHVLPLTTLNADPLIGAMESFLPPALLLNPTTKMKEVAQKISTIIIKTLNFYIDNNFKFDKTDVFDEFYEFATNVIFELKETYPGSLTFQEVCHAFKESDWSLDSNGVKAVINKVIKYLEDGNTSFARIMVIHEQFAWRVMRDIGMRGVDAEVDGRNPFHQRIIENYNNRPDVALSLSELIQSQQISNNRWARWWVSNGMMYETDLYKDRRRLGKPSDKYTQHLGVMRCQDSKMREDLIKWQGAPWVDWTQCSIELSSPSLQAMLYHEVPVISGMSGSTSLLIALMFASNALKSLDEQQVYLCNIMTYLSAVGFHSQHEVLAPAAYCVDLIPETLYPFFYSADRRDWQAPRYDRFYEHISNIDNEFGAKREESWQRLMHWYQTNYLPNAEETPLEDIILGTLLNAALCDRVDLFEHLLLIPESAITDAIKQKINRLIKQNYSKIQPFLVKQQSFFANASHPVFEQVNAIMNPFIIIDGLIEKINKEHQALSLFYDHGNDTFQLSAVQPESSQDCYDSSKEVHLSVLTEKVDALFKALAVDDAVIQTIQDKIASCFRDCCMIINNRDIVTAIKKALLCQPSFNFTSEDWETWLKNQLSGNTVVLKNDDEAKKTVAFDTVNNAVIKYSCRIIDKTIVKEKLLQNQKLFNIANQNNDYAFFIEGDFVTETMPFLGESLDMILPRLTPDEREKVKQQAFILIKRLHKADHVHGDVALKNFVYDSATKIVSLIDYETAMLCAKDDAVSLPLYDAQLMMSINVEPGAYSQQEEKRLLKAVFKQKKYKMLSEAVNIVNQLPLVMSTDYDFYHDGFYFRFKPLSISTSSSDSYVDNITEAMASTSHGDAYVIRASQTDDGQKNNDCVTEMEKILQVMQVEKSVVAAIMAPLNSPDAMACDSFMVTDKSQVAAIKKALLERQAWLMRVKHEINKNKQVLLKEDNLRLHYVVHDADKSQVNKFLFSRLPVIEITKKLQKQKTLFETVNGKPFTFHINETDIKQTTPYLGESLDTLISHLSIKEITTIRQQARLLVKKVHQKGYVHGDVALKNFVYDKTTKVLSLIDFETAVACSESQTVSLGLYNESLMEKTAINPNTYSQQAEKLVLGKVFDEALMQKAKVFSTANTPAVFFPSVPPAKSNQRESAEESLILH